MKDRIRVPVDKKTYDRCVAMAKVTGETVDQVFERCAREMLEAFKKHGVLKALKA